MTAPTGALSRLEQEINRYAPLQATATLLGRLGLSGRSLVIAVPTLWLFVFFLIPFFVVAKISLSKAAISQPPFLPLYARSSESRRNILLMLIILPFWTSFLLRVYAWIGFLKSNGLVNNFLLQTGLISQPLVMLQTDFAVYIGIVYNYLPFMILPLYANLVKLDNTLLEASSDLGARPIVTFFTVTLPLSFPGIIAGSMLVLIPAIGEFVIPSLLGGPDTLMIGRVLWDEFFSNRDWPVASAVAIAMLVVLVIPIMILRKARGAQLEVH
jgi:putrescine transport system permease protein